MSEGDMVYDSEPTGEMVGFDDIELAYRAALEALDAAEEQVGSALVELNDQEATSGGEDFGDSGVSVGQQLADSLRQGSGASADDHNDILVSGRRRVTPSEVIEAALFVGGDVPLTARRLASLVGRDVSPNVAVAHVDALNQKYSREHRPYEIRLHEGGYSLELREQFGDVSQRSFGLGPRDVRLSPDVLEVLAFVAWNQPVTREQLAEIDRENTMTLLRKLIRLQLVELQRTGSGRSDVCYGTTAKFLSVFGLTSLDDLPTADVFEFK